MNLLSLNDNSKLLIQNKGKLHKVQQETRQDAESGLMGECFL